MTKLGDKLSGFYYRITGYRSRIFYWTCSSLSQKIREKTGAVQKPHAATADEWYEWHKENDNQMKPLAKFGSWVADEGLDILQNIWMFIPDVYRKFSIYFTNRFIDKPHYIDTKLKRGEYHELDTRLLYGMFEALVDFIEVEKAHMQRWNSDEKFKTPNAAKGLEYLGWEIALRGTPAYESDDNFDEPDHIHNIQSDKAQEILALYWWWKHIRPKRVDPWDESGMEDFYAKNKPKDEDHDSMWIMRNNILTAKQEQEHNNHRDMMTKIEQDHHDEDTDMMIRLIKLRRDLWT